MTSTKMHYCMAQGTSRFRAWGLGAKSVGMQKKIEKNFGDEMETGFIQGIYRDCDLGACIIYRCTFYNTFTRAVRE